MKTAHWSVLRQQMHARRQRITSTLARLPRPPSWHPITRDGEPVTEVRTDLVRTPRGQALVALNLLDLSRRALSRGGRQRRAR